MFPSAGYVQLSSALYKLRPRGEIESEAQAIGGVPIEWAASREGDR
jgi:hypothetical protein